MTNASGQFTTDDETEVDTTLGGKGKLVGSTYQQFLGVNYER
jgi:hypothetical protein